MTNSQRLAAVRQRLLRWLAQHPSDNSEQTDGSPIAKESMLIRDGFYCGRRFDCSTHYAVWFMEEDELKIHGPEGDLMCVLDSQAINEAESTEAPSTQRAPIAEESAPSEPTVIAMPNRVISERTDDDDEIRRAA